MPVNRRRHGRPAKPVRPPWFIIGRDLAGLPHLPGYLCYKGFPSKVKRLPTGASSTVLLEKILRVAFDG
jgi:hypothetical protein